jgi:hypothetical protein
MGSVRRLALLAAMSVASVNIWTGAPLLALWVGSRVQGDGPPKMGAVFVVVITLAVVAIGLTRLLGWLGGRYDSEWGPVSRVHRHVPWLRSMRGERETYAGDRIVLSALDRTLVIVVVIAVITFEIWFFFFSGSPIDQHSGRG